MTTVLVAGGLGAGVLLLWRRAALPEPAPAGAAPTVSVVVPARDEERPLPRLLASVAAQTVPPAEVLVVDDASTDRTAAVAEAGGARVVASGGPPEGWTGKTWACEVGVGAATGEVVVLLDADTWLERDALARLVAALRQAAPDGLVSVQPFHVTGRTHEQASAVCNLVAVLASGTGAVVRPRRRPVAFGPCLVTTPAALAAAGGFAAVRGDVVEDLALARAFHRAGRPVVGFLGSGAVSYRMYPQGSRALVEGWTKNLVAGASRAPVLPALGASVWVTGALSVGLAAVTSPAPAVALAWTAYAVQTAWMLRRIGSFRWWTWACFPLPTAAFALLVASSALARARGRATWRGRQLALGRRAT